MFKLRQELRLLSIYFIGIGIVGAVISGLGEIAFLQLLVLGVIFWKLGIKEESRGF